MFRLRRGFDLAVMLCLVVASVTAAQARTSNPIIRNLRVDNGGHPFAGDRMLLATVVPGGDHGRAFIRFKLARAALVTLDIGPTRRVPLQPIYHEEEQFAAGSHVLTWIPPASTPPGTYLCQLTVQSDRGLVHYGALSSEAAHRRGTALGPVIRVQGLDGFFNVQGTFPERTVELTVSADAPALTLQFFRFGGTASYDTNATTLTGDPMGPPVQLDWSRWRSRPRSLHVAIGNWPSGLYFVRLEAGDGRRGFAPLVVWPAHPSAARVAVVLPTYTWQAYNFYDKNGDGYGDTWYMGEEQRHVNLARPYLSRGVPLHFGEWDAVALSWFAMHAAGADYLTDGYMDQASAAALRANYDLVVFEGHEEYVSPHTYNAVTGYRNLGGHLIFMSANNFFWRTKRVANVLTRTAHWRSLGRPEAALVGAQYRGNDAGGRLAAFQVRGSDQLPWLFTGCGLSNGDSFGSYGFEIDARAAASPPQTVLVAQAPALYGAGVDAEMTYYETTAGAMVFDAGALNFGGTVRSGPAGCILQNLFDHTH
ncbi:MAG TPA: N,N-dimethylformamidase beta subunit family domain-containing protein [Gaiellaceae bacterium]|nr:N,N-dimethylformamidase beta subunit family domain-containing protein [Gaiellaceae bacterium]